MDEQEQRYVEMITKELEESKIKQMSTQNEHAKQSFFDSQANIGLAELQLDLDKILDRQFHLLSGEYIGKISDNEFGWMPAKSEDDITLSEYGVNEIMSILSTYLNPDILLSNHSETQINWKMRDFGMELNDLIFNQYERFFFYPTPEELFEKYKPLAIKNKIEISDKLLYEWCLIKSKEKFDIKKQKFPIIVLGVMNLVHATYLRSLGGEENRSLRRHMNISLSNNTPPQIPMPTGFKLTSPSTWGRTR